jgi:hypothetical protein
MDETTDGKNSQEMLIRLALSFASLGLLVGSIAGLSSAELTLPLYGFLFAFVGGSVISFLDKVPRQSICLASVALASFALAATFSLYAGLFIKVNELMYLHGGQVMSAKRSASAQILPGKEIEAAGYRALMRSRAGQPLDAYLKEEIDAGNMNLSDACEYLSAHVATNDGSVAKKNE